MRREPAGARSRGLLEEIEGRVFAPWAQRSADSAGRRHREPEHPFRTIYQRDRARIIHCRAFRRLEYKTQVFLNGAGDHYRTRLTHTIEVASIGRTLARALGLNEDLVEAVALAHDLGHAPFGHAAEETLDARMRGLGGFDHNAQSLRVVEHIESVYGGFRGLNLSHEVLEGLRKHAREHSVPGRPDLASHPSPSLEAQAADVADEIAYYSHDLDDGLRSGLVAAEQIESLDLWRDAAREVERARPRCRGREREAAVIRRIIDRQVEDVIAASARAIAGSGVASADDVRRHPGRLVRYSAGQAAANRKLRKFLYANLYYHPAVEGVSRTACGMLGRVFDAYMADPGLLGRSARARVAADGLARAVCDYLSGMTDRFLFDEYRRLFGESEPLAGYPATTARRR